LSEQESAINKAVTSGEQRGEGEESNKFCLLFINMFVLEKCLKPITELTPTHNLLDQKNISGVMDTT
jgi:hypothetical protein